MPLVLESYFITCVSKLFGLELKPVDMKVGDILPATMSVAAPMPCDLEDIMRYRWPKS